MNKSKAIIAFVMGLVLIGLAAFTILHGIGDRGQAKYITRGLDLKGGVSITYQVSDKNKNWSQSDVEDTKNKLELRVQNFSTEAQVNTEGSNNDRITVSIPGQYDADKVLKELGKPGALYFCTKADETPTKKQLDNKEYVQVKGNTGDDGYYKIWVKGDQIKDAKGQATQDQQTGGTEYIVSLTFNDKGADAFGNMTSQYVGQQTYIIYDGKIISAPQVKQAITGTD